MNNRKPVLPLVIAMVAIDFISPLNAQQEHRYLPVDEYRSRMEAGWIGQMAGVGQGFPTEFKFRGRIIPAEAVPTWKPGLINQFDQDDLYTEMTFLRSIEEHGFDVSWRQAGIDFANAGYKVWHANRGGRDNLRAGIAPPDSGHPAFTRHADDIDYQIEADYSGLIAPGLPNTAIALGEIFGRIMNYGDGVYGGQFVGGMVAEAFFEDDPVLLVNAGLACIPEASEYAQCIRDVLAWHGEHPDNWAEVWRRIEAKWSRNRAHRRFSCTTDDLNIDAKLNGAYVVMGILYGDSDPARTIEIAMRCGQDSDCNPSSAAGVVFTSLGMEKIPPQYHRGLNRETKFSHTSYDFNALLDTCEDLARQAVLRAGGRIALDANGSEVFVIPDQLSFLVRESRVVDPGPIDDARFTDEERELIPSLGGVDMAGAMERFAPGWEVLHCGPYDDPGLYENWGGRSNVLLTHPMTDSIGCTLRRNISIAADGEASMHLVVGHDQRGDWTLIVRVDHREIHRVEVDAVNAPDRWLAVDVDLTPFAGKTVLLELVNQASAWRWESGYWAEITLRTD